MSASSKKKLRKAQEAEKLTEKQLAEQKEAKKLKIYSIIFAVVLAVMVVAAVWVAVSKTVAHSGIMERSTAALTVGDHELNNAELNYFYIDAVNNFYSNYGEYTALFGLDVSVPLNEQITNEETGATWADDFLETAKQNAQAVYALADEANAQGYALSEAEQAEITNELAMLTLYSTYYGYSSVDDYLKAMYGNGANEESFRAYAELTALATSYQNHYINSLTYTDAQLREAEAENYSQYSSYSYNSYYLAASKFLEGGTTGEDGTTTYSDEETAASVAAAEEAAKALAEGEYETIADFDAAIAALSINAEATGAASTAYTDTLYASVNSIIRDWVADEARVEGEMTYIPSVTTNTAEDGTETTTTNGYYVVWYTGSNTNEFALANVRHILISYEHDHEESEEHDHTETSYTDEEKAAAKTTAEEILAQWQSGEATEESFAALANEKSADGDGTTGGLYENVYPGQMVTNFNDWCFDEARQAGDTGIVESEYGYHVMFYVGDSDVTYRDYQITEELKSADSSSWYNALIEGMTVTELNTQYLTRDLVLSAE